MINLALHQKVIREKLFLRSEIFFENCFFNARANGIIFFLAVGKKLEKRRYTKGKRKAEEKG